MFKTIVRKLLNKLPPSWSKFPLAVVYYLTNGKQIFAQYKRLKQYKYQLQSTGHLSEERNSFLRTLRKYCLYMNRAGAEKYLDSYFESTDFCLLKRCSPRVISSNDVILICCVKNDLLRIKQVYKHHQKIGIKHMVFVDNGSTDGTLEWLLKQNVDIYQTNESYHAGAKSAWVRKVQDIYGFKRWYLLVDSDELFSYIGMEEHSIAELIDYAERNKICRVQSFLLDMYSSHPLFQGEVSGDDFVKEYCFFDSDSYYNENDCRGIMLRGGPRKRIFEADSNYAQPLSKYPLLYVEYEDVWADHTPMPFEKNFKSPCLSVLCHYKFLPGDQEKFIEIAKSGNYLNESYEYRNYITKIGKNKNLSFYYEKSVEFTSSESLQTISFIKRIF